MSEVLDHQLQLRALATAIERVCNLNCDLRSAAPTVFDAVSVPSMSVHCYLVRLHRYTKFDFVCFHVAAWYLHQLCKTDSAYCPTLHNIHRLLVTALLVASKATDDIFHANVFMAQCGGIGGHELNKLEVDLCERLHWRLLPTTDDMRELRDAVSNPAAGFWNCWYNRRTVAAASSAASDADADATQQQQPSVAVTKLPHARSVHDSLARLFRGGASEGNLEAMGAATSTAAAPLQQQQGRAVSPTAPESAKNADGSNKSSPRSITSRTFSLSNLFGLASGW